MTRTGRFAALVVVAACVVAASRLTRVGAAPAPASERPDVVLIVVDALRADRLALYGYSRPTTPWLVAHRDQVRWFTDAVTESTHTVPSMASLFTGAPPYEHGVQFDTIGRYFPPTGASPRLDTPLPTLAEAFRQSGYYTVGVVGNPWLTEATRFNRGFARFDDWKAWDRNRINDDAGMIEAAAALLVPPDESPRFVWIHMMTVHNPYDKGHRTMVRGQGTERYVNGPAAPPAADLAFMSDLYDSNIAYTDGLIGNLVDRLARRPKQRPIVVCIVGDHGEEFLEHGGLGHGTTLFHEQARVPVVVWAPSLVRQGGPLATPIRLSEMRALLLAAGGGPASRLTALLGAKPAGKPAPPLPAAVRTIELNNEKAVFEAPWKYIVTRSPFSERLFNLSQDAAERIDRAPAEAEVVRRMREVARRWWPDLHYPNR